VEVGCTAVHWTLCTCDDLSADCARALCDRSCRMGCTESDNLKCICGIVAVRFCTCLCGCGLVSVISINLTTSILNEAATELSVAMASCRAAVSKSAGPDLILLISCTTSEL